MSDNPSAEAYAVGWALFHAQCVYYGADQDVIDTQWGLLATRNFWLGQAQIALDALTLHRMASSDGK